MAHIRAGESCSRVQRGAPFANVDNFVTHLEVVWHPMSIMSLLVLSIGSVQDVMNLLADVLNALNEAICLVSLRLDMG